MKFQRISDWSRRHPVMAGSIGFLVVIILIFLAFDSYTRIRLASEIWALERMGIPCDIEGFAERQRMRGNSREVFEEFLAHCRALSTENFPAPDASSPYTVLEPNDLSQFLVGRAEEIQAFRVGVVDVIHVFRIGNHHDFSRASRRETAFHIPDLFASFQG